MKEERVKTGIDGLDELLNGGFIPNSIVLVSGKAGAGKTIFSMQFLYKGATLFNEPGIYVTTEETPEHLKRAASLFGWDLDSLEKEKKLKIVSIKPFKIEQLPRIITQHKQSMQLKRMVIDSISMFVMYLKDVYVARKMLFDVVKLLQKLGITTIFTSEILSQEKEALSRSGIEEFIVDAVLVLDNLVIGGQFKRVLKIIKMRMSDHSKKIHPFEITPQGIKVMKV
jgi:KaiC/GvpD/RAD55 family RecA-like ATPase